MDLQKIGRYIGKDNSARAGTFIRDIHKKSEAYAVHPDMGRDRSDLAKGIRSFPHGDYVIFYRRYRNGIQIVRVFNGYRDISPDTFLSDRARDR